MRRLSSLLAPLVTAAFASAGLAQSIVVSDQGATAPGEFEVGQLTMNNRFGFNAGESYSQSFTLSRSIALDSIFIAYNQFDAGSGTFTLRVDAQGDGTFELEETGIVLSAADFSGAPTDGNGGPFYWMRWDVSDFDITLPAGSNSYELECTSETPSAAGFVFAAAYSFDDNPYPGGSAGGVLTGFDSDAGFAVTAEAIVLHDELYDGDANGAGVSLGTIDVGTYVMRGRSCDSSCTPSDGSDAYCFDIPLGLELASASVTNDGPLVGGAQLFDCGSMSTLEVVLLMTTGEFPLQSLPRPGGMSFGTRVTTFGSDVNYEWKVVIAKAFTEACHGDGGDQQGCTECPCDNNAPQGTIGGCLNSAATSARLRPSGSRSIAAADLRFEASGVAPSNSCVLASGNAIAPTNMSNSCFGLDSGIQSIAFDGLRCAVQGVLRHGVRPSDANGDIGVTTNGWGDPNGFFQFDAFSAGTTKHFQAIYRDDADAVCMRGQNTSQAVSVTFVP